MSFIDDIKYKFIKDLIIIILLVLIIILNVIFFINKRENTVVKQDKNIALVSKEEIKDEDNSLNENKDIRVDVKGAVKQQGVYLFKDGAIVNDAIEAAGGVTNKGVTKNINLSKKLSDQMVIYVYTSAELNNYKKELNVDTKENVIKEECNCPNYEISSCEGASIIINKESVNPEQENNTVENNKVNINTATKEQLMSLTGIGESKANAIIEYRNKNGLFNNIEDIMNVSGIGEALFAKIKENITI